jgi:hypothetical protein
MTWQLWAELQKIDITRFVLSISIESIKKFVFKVSFSQCCQRFLILPDCCLLSVYERHHFGATQSYLLNNGVFVL